MIPLCDIEILLVLLEISVMMIRLDNVYIVAENLKIVSALPFMTSHFSCIVKIC